MTPSTHKRWGSRPALILQKKSRLPTVFAMTDETRLSDASALAKTMPSHWGLVFRHYGTADRVQLAADVSRICKARRIFLVIAGDWRLAHSVDADGVHMPEGLLRNHSCAALLHICRTKTLMTSAHGAAGLRLAKTVGADGVFLSSVNVTKSHSDATPLGRWSFAALARNCGVPAYALGGIKLQDRSSMLALGAAGIAGISLAEENA